MNISEIAFRNRLVVLATTLVLMLFGTISFFSLPAREDPEILIREALVVTQFPGMSAERVDRLITKSLEEHIRQIAEIKEIRSSSTTGMSTIHVVIEDRYFDLDQIWDDLRKRVRGAAAELPDGTYPSIINDDFGDVAVLTVALTADGFEMSEVFDMAQHVRDMLYNIDGTKKVDILGIQPERIYIDTTNARLAQMGLSSQSVVNVLRSQNVIQPGGEIDTGGRTFIVEPTGNFESLDDIGDMLIPLPDSEGVIAIKDVAEVRRGYLDPPRDRVYFNGKQALMLSIGMQSHVRVLEYAERMTEALDEIRSTQPIGYHLDIATYQATQVANTVYGVTANVLQTLAIVLTVAMVFLGVRTGLIVGSIVPAVMLITLAIMGIYQMPLERMSLATLVIALGLLVDNGIVIAEDFKRRLEHGASREDALRQSGKELAMPLLSSTLTTVLFFLPLILAEHSAGEYTRSISLIILISLSTSWVLAMTVTPTLCYYFIKTPSKGAINTSPKRFDLVRVFQSMNVAYERLLRQVMGHRALIAAGAVMLLVGSIGALTQAPSKFFPDSDRAQILVYIDLPAGVSTNTTDAAMQRLMGAWDDEERFPHVVSHATYVGFGGPRFVLSLTPMDPASNRAFAVLNIDDQDGMTPTINELRALLATDFTDLHAQVSRMFLGPSDSTKLEVQVKGPDKRVVYEAADALRSALLSVPGSIEISHDWENLIPKIRVDVDQFQARRAGVSSATIADRLETYFNGRAISAFREGDEIIPIMTRADESERLELDRLASMSLDSDPGRPAITLSQVATIEIENTYSRIERENMMPTLTVEARNLNYSAEDFAKRVKPALDELAERLPPGHSIEFDGVVVESAEGAAAMQVNIPLCLGLVGLLLIAQFNSLGRAAIIASTVPLLLIGAVIGLYTMRADFGFMPLLGLYALAGIIINNAIVLIDRIDIERSAGTGSDFEAIIRASVLRLRPIVMTTVTTVVGLLPLILANDPLFYGMSSVIAFGLLIGTVLTLGVVPVLYSLFFKITPEARA